MPKKVLISAWFTYHYLIFRTTHRPKYLSMALYLPANSAVNAICPSTFKCVLIRHAHLRHIRVLMSTYLACLERSHRPTFIQKIFTNSRLHHFYHQNANLCDTLQYITAPFVKCSLYFNVSLTFCPFSPSFQCLSHASVSILRIPKSFSNLTSSAYSAAKYRFWIGLIIFLCLLYYV